jgi:hypothetical protein
MAWEITGNSGTNPDQPVNPDFLGTTDNNALAIRTNKTERMRIDTSGNIGIGTAAPRSKLQINSLTALNEGSTTNGAWANLGSNSYFDGAWKRIDAAKPGVNLHMNADDGAGQEFRFHREEVNSTARNLAVIGSQTSYISGGKVGIGTTNPTAALEVAASVQGLKVGVSGNMANANVEVVGDLEVIGHDASSVSTVGASAWNFYNSGNNPSWSGTLLRYYGQNTTGTVNGLPTANQGAIVFQNLSNGVIASNGQTNLYIAPYEKVSAAFLWNGNVGIGTQAPQSKLQINSLTALNEGSTTNGAWANLGSNSYFDGAWKRIDATKPGVNLHMNADDGAGQEFRFHREEVNSTARNLAVIGSQTSYISGGNVGIGTTSPGSDVTMAGGLTINGSGATQLTVENNSTSGFALNVANGQWAMYDKAGGTWHESVSSVNGNVGIGAPIPGPGSDVAMSGGLTINGSGATQLTVQSSGTSGFALNVSSGQWTMYDKVGGTWNSSITSQKGNVGIGVGADAPSSKLDVRGGNISVTNMWTPPPQEDAGGIQVFSGSVSAPGQVGPVLALWNVGGGVNSSAAIDFWTYDPGEGNPPDHWMNPSSRIQAVDDGNYSNHIVFLTNAAGATNNGLVERLRITAQGAVGIGTNAPASTLHVNGDITANGDILLPGADCAERFALVSLDTLEPGTVVVIEDSGALCQSTEAYDTRVAGVVSGAGDYRQGIVLGNKPSDSNNSTLVALIGKVFCKVDASYAPIRAGDLLVASPTPGHAMKALDKLRAHGAILGKALRSLNSVRGLIPILVTLQ